MYSVTLTDEQRVLVLDILASRYQRLHREAWEVKVSGDPKYLDEYRVTLAALRDLLKQLGSSDVEVMRPLTGDEPPVDI